MCDMKGLLRTIDQVSEKVGLTIRWIVILMLLATSYEVVARYFFNSPTVWAHQSVMIMGGLLIPLSWGFVHLHQSHVSMDILYRRLSLRNQGIVRAVCTVLFLFPLLGLLTYVCAQWLIDSWVSEETWIVSIWYPPMWPSRAFMMLGFALFFFQGAAGFVRDIYFLAVGEQL